MNGPVDWIDPRLVQALGWTIIHSLWQGILAAAIYAVARGILERSHPRLRYGAGLLILALLTAASVLTFQSVYGVMPGSVPLTEVAARSAPRLQSGSGLSIWGGIEVVCARNISWIVAAWFLGTGLLSLRFLAGWLIVFRIRRRGSRPVSRFWEAKLAELRKRMQIRKPLSLRESRQAQAPFTLGHWKPVVFFPFGALAGLPPDQAEALLVHELAHIQRHDYLINLLQQICDIFYFFHPGVRWISRSVRREREYCSDETVAAITGDRLSIARALLQIRITAGTGPVLALGAGGRKHHLLERIRRILHMNQKKSTVTANLIGLTICFLFIGVALFAFNTGGTDTKKPKALPVSVTEMVPPDAPVPVPIQEPSEVVEPAAAPQAVDVPESVSSDRDRIKLKTLVDSLQVRMQALEKREAKLSQQERDEYQSLLKRLVREQGKLVRMIESRPERTTPAFSRSRDEYDRAVDRAEAERIREHDIQVSEAGKAELVHARELARQEEFIAQKELLKAARERELLLKAEAEWKQKQVELAHAQEMALKAKDGELQRYEARLKRIEVQLAELAAAFKERRPSEKVTVKEKE